MIHSSVQNFYSTIKQTWHLIKKICQILKKICLKCRRQLKLLVHVYILNISCCYCYISYSWTIYFRIKYMSWFFQVWYPEFRMHWTILKTVVCDDGCKRHNRYSVVLLKQKTNTKKTEEKKQQQKTKTYESPLNEPNKNMWNDSFSRGVDVSLSKCYLMYIRYMYLYFPIWHKEC